MPCPVPLRIHILEVEKHRQEVPPLEHIFWSRRTNPRLWLGKGKGEAQRPLRGLTHLVERERVMEEASQWTSVEPQRAHLPTTCHGLPSPQSARMRRCVSALRCPSTSSQQAKSKSTRPCSRRKCTFPQALGRLLCVRLASDGDSEIWLSVLEAWTATAPHELCGKTSTVPEGSLGCMPPTSIRAGRGETGASFVIWIRAGCCKDGPDGPGWMGWMGRIGQGNTNAGVCVHLGRGETRRKRKRERFFLSFSLSLLRAPSALSPYNVVTIQRAVLGFVPGYCIWVHSLGRLGSHSPRTKTLRQTASIRRRHMFRFGSRENRTGSTSTSPNAARSCLFEQYLRPPPRRRRACLVRIALLRSLVVTRRILQTTTVPATGETITSIVYQISNSPNYTSRWTPHSIRSNLLFAICYLLSAICCLLRTYCLRSPPRNPTSPTKLYQQPPSPPFGHPPIQKPIQPIQRLIQAQLNFSATLVSS